MGLFGDRVDPGEVGVGQREPGVRQRQHPAKAARRQEPIARGALLGLREDRPAPLVPRPRDGRVQQSGTHAPAPLGPVHGDFELREMPLPLLREEPQKGGPDRHPLVVGREPGPPPAGRGGFGVGERGHARRHGVSVTVGCGR